MMAGKERVVSSSLYHQASRPGQPLIPDKVEAKMHSRMAEPGSADR
jgi:hypothetical protein